MKKDIFAVCDLDASYAVNLMDYLNGKKTTPFEIQAFTNVESLQKFAGQQDIEILLISTKAMCEEVRGLSIRRIIILTEGEQLKDLGEYPFVYKYQSSDQILSEVMEYYAVDHPSTGMLPHKKGTQLYGVYSPIGRSRKTMFALTLGEVLAEKKSVLYINFEPFSGFEQLFDVRYRMDISDLIYFARQKEGGLIFKLHSVVRNFMNLHYIPPALSPMDIRDVTGQEWIEFLHEIISCSEYEAIIIEMNEQVADFMELLKLCDKIYMPVQDDMISSAKMTQYERLLGMMNMEEIKQKTTKVKPPLQMLQKESEQLTQQLAWGEMGNYVRSILAEES